MEEYTKKIYITIDGKEFDTAYEAKKHEKELLPEYHYGEFLLHLSIGFPTKQNIATDELKNYMRKYIMNVISRVESSLNNDDTYYPYDAECARLYKAAFVDNTGSKIEFEK